MQLGEGDSSIAVVVESCKAALRRGLHLRSRHDAVSVRVPARELWTDAARARSRLVEECRPQLVAGKATVAIAIEPCKAPRSDQELVPRQRPVAVPIQNTE